MGTRCSGRSPRSAIFMGAATFGKETTGTPVGIALAAIGLIAFAAVAPSTSPLVTRPSLPVPGTEPDAMLLSAINLAADGMGTPAMELPVAATDAAAAGALATAAGAATAPTLPSVSILAITWSDTTVPPSATVNSISTPAEGAGTSRTTLSVSISIRVSSMAMASPTFFFHCNMVASATDSDNWGTLTSTMAILFLSCVFLFFHRSEEDLIWSAQNL